MTIGVFFKFSVEAQQLLKHEGNSYRPYLLFNESQRITLQYMFSVPECPDNECRAWSFLALFLCHRATAVLSRAIPPVCGIKMPDLNWHIERKENRLLTQKNIWESKSDDFRVGGKSAELFPEVGYLSLLKRCSSTPVTQILGKIQRMSMLMPQKTTAQCII